MRRELTTVKAVCPHDCPDACGMVVTVDATGRAVDIFIKDTGEDDRRRAHGLIDAHQIRAPVCMKAARFAHVDEIQ